MKPLKINVRYMFKSYPVEGGGAIIEADMTTAQMKKALWAFLERITDSEWAEWLAEIEREKQS